MKTFTYTRLNECANNGIDIEHSIIYALTGKRKEKHDNTPYDKASDILDYQIKSARASVCYGDIDEHLKRDKAKAYIYGTKDGTAYIMTKEEYKAFVKAFGTLTTDSAKKNGGRVKLRLKHESIEMVEYLKARAG